MKFLQTVCVFALILFVSTGFAAKKEKKLICHVGNEVGPGGEVYDPACIPEEANNFFCADAGKIDLVLVSKIAKHLNNPSHIYDGISDYTPDEVGASGDSTEDSNGDGIDDGCEPAQTQTCPCWDESDLMAVTADNVIPQTCEGSNFRPPTGAHIANTGSNQNGGVEGGFLALLYPGSTLCATRDFPPYEQFITDEEASACIDQIAARCAAIGHPIP